METNSAKDNKILANRIIKYNLLLFILFIVSCHNKKEKSIMLENKGDIFYKENNYKSALFSYNQAYKIYPSNNISFKIGRAYFLINELDSSLYYLKIFNKYNTNLECIFLIANIYERKMELDSSILYYDKAITIDSSISFYYNNCGSVYMDKGKLELALNYYNFSIKLDTNLLEAYNNRGLVYQELGKYREALNDFDFIISKDSSLYYYYLNRGITRMCLNMDKEAIDDFNKASNNNTNVNSNIYLNRGIAYYNINNRIESCKDFQKASLMGNKKAKEYIDKLCNSTNYQKSL